MNSLPFLVSENALALAGKATVTHKNFLCSRINQGGLSAAT